MPSNIPNPNTAVEQLLYKRGVEISHETARCWWNRHCPVLATEIFKKTDQLDAILLELAMAPSFDSARD